uniref:Uncharacterized protein n=1 Tax=Anopheles arabiensis TaxID=7173 RepID=A0A182IHI9_ANOAR
MRCLCNQHENSPQESSASASGSFAGPTTPSPGGRSESATKHPGGERKQNCPKCPFANQPRRLCRTTAANRVPHAANEPSDRCRLCCVFVCVCL